MAPKRQSFKQGDIVFLCISRGGAYSLPSWGKAEVIEYPWVGCSQRATYHQCHSDCVKKENPRLVRVHRLDRHGKRQEHLGAEKSVRNSRSFILTLEEGTPIVEDIERTQVQRDRNLELRRIKQGAKIRIDKAALYSIESIKEASVILTQARPNFYRAASELALDVLNNALKRVRAPKAGRDV